MSCHFVGHWLLSLFYFILLVIYSFSTVYLPLLYFTELPRRAETRTTNMSSSDFFNDFLNCLNREHNVDNCFDKFVVTNVNIFNFLRNNINQNQDSLKKVFSVRENAVLFDFRGKLNTQQIHDLLEQNLDDILLSVISKHFPTQIADIYTNTHDVVQYTNNPSIAPTYDKLYQQHDTFAGSNPLPHNSKTLDFTNIYQLITADTHFQQSNPFFFRKRNNIIPQFKTDLKNQLINKYQQLLTIRQQVQSQLTQSQSQLNDNTQKHDIGNFIMHLLNNILILFMLFFTFLKVNLNKSSSYTKKHGGRQHKGQHKGQQHKGPHTLNNNRPTKYRTNNRTPTRTKNRTHKLTKNRTHKRTKTNT